MRVSSAAITATLCNSARPRGLRSSKWPIGVATTHKQPFGLEVAAGAVVDALMQGL
jgi:hypothetical protein